MGNTLPQDRKTVFLSILDLYPGPGGLRKYAEQVFFCRIFQFVFFIVFFLYKGCPKGVAGPKTQVEASNKPIVSLC